MSKSELQRNLAQLHADEIRGRLIVHATSGSTGQPLKFPRDALSVSAFWANWLLTRSWWGVAIGDYEATIWGHAIKSQSRLQGAVKRTRDLLRRQLTRTLYLHEAGVSHNGGGPMLLTAYTVGGDGETFFNFAVRPKPGSPYEHWYLNYYVNPNTVEEEGMHRTAIGSNKDDIGRWTDFVIRFRANPFSVDTDPAQKGIRGAADKLFRANKGILQVWKSVGTRVDAKGDRPMELVLDIENAPVGNVPSKEDQILLSFRVYKGGWRNVDTTVKGPIWFGFDEIRFGSAVFDGTGFSDVNPGMAAETLLRPLPPTLHAQATD